MEGGFETPKKKPTAAPEGVIAADMLKFVRDGLVTKQESRKTSPDREIDPELASEEVGPELIGEYPTNHNPKELREALIEIDAPNVEGTEH